MSDFNIVNACMGTAVLCLLPVLHLLLPRPPHIPYRASLLRPGEAPSAETFLHGSTSEPFITPGRGVPDLLNPIRDGKRREPQLPYLHVTVCFAVP